MNCCCDSDCPAEVVARWTRNPSVNCQEHYKSYRTIPFAACSAETNRRQLTDIQNGLQYFGKLGNLLMCAAKTGKIQDTQKFVEGLRGAPSGSQSDDDYKKSFEAMDKQKIEDFAVLNYESAGRKSALMSSTSGAAGYQPYESLRGVVVAPSSGSGSTTVTVQPSGVLTVQQAGVFGECTDSGILGFLRPVEKSKCSFLPRKLGRDFCEKGLSIRKLLGT